MNFVMVFIIGVMGMWIVANFMVRKVARRYKLEIKVYKEEIMRLNEWIIAAQKEK